MEHNQTCLSSIEPPFKTIWFYPTKSALGYLPIFPGDNKGDVKQLDNDTIEDQASWEGQIGLKLQSWF